MKINYFSTIWNIYKNDLRKLKVYMRWRINKKINRKETRPIVNEDMYDYIANILATGLLARNNEKENKILCEEHEEVVKKIIENWFF